MPRYVDLSHVIEDGLVTYPGLPAPTIDEFLTRAASRERYAPGTEFSIGRISMIGNTGTYLDSPYHRFESGADIADLPLEHLVDLDAVRISVSQMRRDIDVDALASHAVGARAVLIHTGWDRHWGSAAYGSGNPFLTDAAAAYLVDQGALLVGIDSLNIDDTADAARPAHTRLLAAGIPIVEHLCNLGQLPPEGFRFSAVPPRVRGIATWPVRAYAVIDQA